MSAFERYAAGRLVDQARAVGVEVPAELLATLDGHDPSWPARWWAEHHRADEPIPCCDGSAVYGAQRCTCWQPVYEVEQAEPRPPKGPEDLRGRRRMCGDCAFRKDSPERSYAWGEEALFELADKGEPFWCHEGMRRPTYWRHPDGRTVPGSPHDWQPAQLGQIPYQADGSPGLLCAGWLARAARAQHEHTEDPLAAAG